MITPKPRSGGRPHNAVMQRLASDPAWMAQAKIDGWRARWRDGALRSRAGMLLHQCPALIAELQEHAAGLWIDAEITFSAGDKADAQLWCFDLPALALPLHERLEVLRGICEAGNRMRLIPCDVAWQDVEREAWEGLVFKRRDSAYPRTKVTDSWVKYRR